MKEKAMRSPGVIEFREIPVPAPAQGQILVKMKRIGVCGSDIMSSAENTYRRRTLSFRGTKCPVSKRS
jgi:D-arabinose 1-dehydrogenase-like Zn-dependent alcohol dehydrogenase